MTARHTLRLAPALPEAAPSATGNGRARDVLGLLSAGIPLTLLIDLASPAGPDSRAIFEAESIEVRMSRTA